MQEIYYHQAVKIFSKIFPNIEINVLEVAPAEAIDLLYARQVKCSCCCCRLNSCIKFIFFYNEVLSDPYVLAVPKDLNLRLLKDTNELKNKEKYSEIYNIFEFGSQHKKRIQ